LLRCAGRKHLGSWEGLASEGNVNQESGGRKSLHHRTVGRFEVSEMNGKGRLIVSNFGEYSHLTMPSQIFDQKTQTNHLEFSVHKQKKKTPSAFLFSSTSNPPRPPFLFVDSTSSLSSRPLRHRTPFQPGCRPSLLVTTRARTSWQLVGDVKIGAFPCVFIPLRHGSFADLTAFYSIFVTATSLPPARLSASLFDGSIIGTPLHPTFK